MLSHCLNVKGTHAFPLSERERKAVFIISFAKLLIIDVPLTGEKRLKTNSKEKKNIIIGRNMTHFLKQ